MDFSLCLPLKRPACQDPDWQDDFDDMIADSRLHFLTWCSFDHPEIYKSHISTELWQKIEAKFDRCRRIEEKRPQIDAETEAYKQQENKTHKQYWESRTEEEMKEFRKSPLGKYWEESLKRWREVRLLKEREQA
jgi:hypothetical protein